MSIVLNGTTGITTPDVTSDSYTGALAVNANAPDDSLVVDASGNVGIGTSSPASKLHVAGTGETGVRIDDTGTARYAEITFGTTNSAMVIGSQGGSPYPIVFETDSAERMRINSSGNLLVGATSASVSPAHHLIQGGNELNLAGAIASSTIYFNYRAGTTLTALRFMNGTGTTSYVACYGTSFTNSSDYRIKTDVQEVGSVLEKVAQLRPLNYIKEGVIGREFGLIAHEAQAVFPDIVSGEKDAVDEDGDMEIQGIDYAQLSTILVKAIQEQQAQIEALTARVSALEASNV